MVRLDDGRECVALRHANEPPLEMRGHKVELGWEVAHAVAFREEE